MFLFAICSLYSFSVFACPFTSFLSPLVYVICYIVVLSNEQIQISEICILRRLSVYSYSVKYLFDIFFVFGLLIRFTVLEILSECVWKSKRFHRMCDTHTNAYSVNHRFLFVHVTMTHLVLYTHYSYLICMWFGIDATNRKQHRI